MIDYIETAKAGAIILGPILGCTGMWTFLNARQKVRAAAPAQMLTSQAGLVAALNAQTKILLDEHAKDRRDLKRRVDRQGTQITQLGRKVADCNDHRAECEATLASVKEQVDRLMADRDTQPLGDYDELRRY